LITFDPRKHGDPVGMIQASGGAFQTSSGVGIGSTRSAVGRALPAFACSARTCVRRSGPVTMRLTIGTHGHVVLITVTDARYQSPLL
jgi:tetrahydromethanopterin S-methyltransferase subunit D